MSTVALLPAGNNLIDEIVPMLAGKGRDYSGTVAVFPGKRPAHALRSALAKQVGTSFLPPRIYSIDHFIDFLLEDELHEFAASLDPLDAVALLHEIYLGDAHRPGGDHFLSLDAFLPLGLKVFGELEELTLADVPLRRVQDTLSGIAFGGFTSLLVFYEKLYSLARERKLATRSMKYRMAAENLPAMKLDGFSKLIFAGFFAFTNTEKKIFRHFASLDNVVQIFQNGPGMSGVLADLGLSPAVPERPADEPTYHFYRSADSHGQVFVLTEKIQKMMSEDATSLQRTAIVLPASDTLFPLFHQTLALLPDDAYNISLGYPVKRTPVYGFLETLMELLVSKDGGRLAVQSYIKFVLHPYTKNIRFGNRSEVTRILFNTVEELFLKGGSPSFFTLEELEGNAALFDRAAKRLEGTGDTVSADQLKSHLMSIHDKTVRTFDNPENIGDCAARAAAVISFIDAHSTARLHPFFRPFAESLIGSLQAIEGSLLREKKFARPDDYVSFLRNVITDAEVPFTGTPLHGLQVLGFLETRNLRFERVFLLDANDDVIPGSKGHDVLLPFKLRQSLGLATYRDREKVAEYYFHLLLSGAKEVHCFFTEGGKKEKSRFIEKLLWQKEQENGRVGSDEHLQTVRYRVQLRNTAPEPIPKTEAVQDLLKGFSFSATSLDTYLRCPLRFYYAFVLQLRERAEVTAELEPADVGSIVHKILASLFRPLIGTTLTREAISLSSLERVVQDCFAKEYGHEPLGAEFLFKMQTASHLRDFVLHYQHERDGDEATLLELELKLTASIGGCEVVGTLDRIERRGNQTYILDYKTGASDAYTKIHFDKLIPEDRESWNEAIGSLQLPLYALLYAKSTSTPVGQIVPAYLFLGKEKIDGTIEVGLFDGSDAKEDRYKMLEGIIVRLMDEITGRETPFLPTNHIEKECPCCPYHYLCGTQWAGE